MIWKTVHEDQLFVWWNGQLIFKRWMKGLYAGHNVVLNPGFPAEFFWDEDWKWDNGQYREKNK